MPIRQIPLVTNQYYHVFNRGVDKMQIYSSVRDYKKFIDTCKYYMTANRLTRLSYWNPTKNLAINNDLHVEIIAYCLMPNHFHFLLKQVREDGITEFMRLLQNSYTKYFNIKHKREGPLLQGRFKSSHISDTDILIHVSRYIHLNPIVSFVTTSLNSYRWSSYYELIHNSYTISNQQEVLELFKNQNDYISFVQDHKDYAEKLERIKHLTHENPNV